MRLAALVVIAFLPVISAQSAHADRKNKPVSIEFRGEDGKVVVETQDIQSSAASQEPDTKQWVVALHLTPDAATRFQEYTRDHVKQKLSILVDGKVMSSPVIQTEIAGGHAQVTGHFSKRQADRLVHRIEEATGGR